MKAGFGVSPGSLSARVGAKNNPLARRRTAATALKAAGFVMQIVIAPLPRFDDGVRRKVRSFSPDRRRRNSSFSDRKRGHSSLFRARMLAGRPTGRACARSLEPSGRCFFLFVADGDHRVWVLGRDRQPLLDQHLDMLLHAPAGLVQTILDRMPAPRKAL